MASRFPKDNLTRGVTRGASGKVLVNMSEAATWDPEVTDNDQATRGLLRDAAGAILVEVTGLPSGVGGSVVNPNTMAMIGPSTEEIAGQQTASPILLGSGAQTSRQMAGLNYWLNGRMKLVYNGGRSGDNSAQIRARMEDVIAAAGKPGFWDIGTLPGNDFGTVFLAQSLDNMQAIFDRFDREPGIKIACTMTNFDGAAQGLVNKPGGGSPYTELEYADRVAAHDRFIRDYVRSHRGWVLCDYHQAVTRSSRWISGYSSDGLHGNHLGGEKMGRVKADAIRSFTSPDSGLSVGPDSSVPTGDQYFFRGAAANEIQHFYGTGKPTAGSFTLTVPANGLGVPSGTTSPIAYNAGAAGVKSALEAILGSGTISATYAGDLSLESYVTFVGSLAGKTIPLMTINASGLTGTTNAMNDRVAAGGLPPGWTGGGNGVKFSVELRDDGLGNWQVVECVENGASAALSVVIPNAALPRGKAFYGEAEVDVAASWVNPTKAQLRAITIGPFVSQTTCFLAEGQTPSPLAPNFGPSRGVYRTPISRMPADQDLTYGVVNFEFAADLGSKVRIGRMGPRIF